MDGLMSRLQEAIFERKLPPLLARQFVKTAQVDGLPQIRVMQWNILAQALTQGDDNFILCPTEALTWENRKLRITEEIVRCSPSILCVEEVDMFGYIKETLSAVGYDGIFCAKPDSPCLIFDNNMGPDGCAIFYNTEQLELMEKEQIRLKTEDGRETNQVSILCKFRLKTSKSVDSVIYANVCHLKAKAGYEELRHQQGKYILEVLKQKIGSHPVVICGDFNAMPKELVYGDFASSDLGLASAYTLLSTDGKEPDYTTWKIRGTPSGQTDSCKTIDYIWYSSAKTRVDSVYSIPLPDDIGKGRLPSYTYPSDHFSLVCDLTLTGKGK